MRAAILFFAGLTIGSLTINPVQGATQTETHRLHLGPIAAGESPYVYLPFEVPAAAAEIVVQVDYERMNGDNAVDFAIFDARFSGRADDLTGYRGKNPNRLPLVSVVGRTSASYGHIPGPLPAGVWRIMFYVYKTVAQGVDLTARISIVSDGVAKPESGAQWLRGDLHVHTLHSDGSWTVGSAAAAAQEAGLDFLAITDHNVASHHSEIAALPAGGPLVLNGVEVTTYGGHMNAWGVPTGQVLEHRQLPGDHAAIQRTVTQAHEMGALISVNHPFATCKACDWGFDKQAANFDGVEVWNGRWTPEDQQALDWWDTLLRSGRRITAIGSSDSHGLQNALGNPTSHVYARRDQASLLSAIKAGRVNITAHPEMNINMEMGSSGTRAGPGEDLAVAKNSSVRVSLMFDRASTGEVILRSNNGEVRRWRLQGAAFREEVELPALFTFLRLEVRDEKGDMLALTNPVWLRLR